jgi:ribosomal-protein-alanine N-acetyltransferase
MEKNSNQIRFDIIPANWRDLSALRRIEKECFPLDAWPLFDLIAVLTFSNVVRLKAVVKDQIVGFVAGERRHGENVGWIATIAVLPEFQHNGIATALMDDCERKLDVTRIRLSVREGNAAAIHLYEESGYRRIGRWSSYYQDGSDAIVYEKRSRVTL